MGETVGKRFHVQPARSLFLSPVERNSFSSNRQVGWVVVVVVEVEGDETTLNEKRERRLRVEGVELEGNVARKRGADDSGGIQTVHSRPVCCYV